MEWEMIAFFIKHSWKYELGEKNQKKGRVKTFQIKHCMLFCKIFKTKKSSENDTFIQRWKISSSNLWFPPLFFFLICLYSFLPTQKLESLSASLTTSCCTKPHKTLETCRTCTRRKPSHSYMCRPAKFCVGRGSGDEVWIFQRNK